MNRNDYRDSFNNTKERLKYATSNYDINDMIGDEYQVIKKNELKQLTEGKDSNSNFNSSQFIKNLDKEEFRKKMFLKNLSEKNKERFQRMLDDGNSLEDSKGMINIIKQREDKEKMIDDYRRSGIDVDENGKFVPKPEERFNVSLPDIDQFSSEDIKNSGLIGRTVKTGLNALGDVYQIADGLVTSALNPIDTYNTIKEVGEGTKLNLTQGHQLGTDREEYLKELSRKAGSEMVKSYTDTHNSFNEDPLLTTLDIIPALNAASKVVGGVSKTSKIGKVGSTLDKLDVNKIASNKISDGIQKTGESFINKSDELKNQSKDIKKINDSIQKYKSNNISGKLEEVDKKELLRKRIENNYVDKNKDNLNKSIDSNSFEGIQVTNRVDSNKMMNDLKEFNLNNIGREKTKQFEFEKGLFKDNNTYKVNGLSTYVDDVLSSNGIKRDYNGNYDTSFMSETHSRGIMIPLVNELKKIDLDEGNSLYDLYKFRNSIDELRTVFDNTNGLNSNVFKTKLDGIIKYLDDNLSKINSDYRNSIKLKQDLNEGMKSLENGSNGTIFDKVIDNMINSGSIYFGQELKGIARIGKAALGIGTGGLSTAVDLSMKMFMSNRFRNNVHDFGKFITLAENSSRLQKFLEKGYGISGSILSIVGKTLRELGRSKIMRSIGTNTFRFGDGVVKETNDYRNEENKKLFEQKIKSMNDEQERYRYY